MKVKTQLCLALAILMILVVAPVSAQGTLLVNPSSIVDKTKIAGTTFTITVEVDAGVTNLWGYEFKLLYNTTILTATLSTPSANFPDVSFNMINDTAGWVWVAASLPPSATDGLDGPQTLVTIEFSVDAYGGSTLDIDEDYTILISMGGKLITPTITDGYFSNKIPGDANGDRKVDPSDLLDLSKAYGSTPSKSNWNLNCDFNWDRKVDVPDLFDLGKNYGTTV